MFTSAVILVVIILIVLLPFVMNELAVGDLFFTHLETGNIKYLYRGDTLRRAIADVRGKKLTEDYKLVNLTPGEEVAKTWWEEKFGLYWVGIPPFNSVKRFGIKRMKEVEIFADKKSTEWIRDLGEIETDSLRAIFPRPFLLDKVELKDRQTVDVLAVTKLEVVDVYTTGPLLKWDFFELAGSIIKAAIIDILERKDMDGFLAADKGEGTSSLVGSELLNPNETTTSEFNKILEDRTGLRLVGIAIPQWDPSDEDTRKAMNAKFIAEKEREAQIIAAKAYEEQLGIRNEADAVAMERTAKARGAHVRATLEALARDGATADTIVKAAENILRAEAQVNLTTLVEGGAHVQTVVPVGGGRS